MALGAGASWLAKSANYTATATLRPHNTKDFTIEPVIPSLLSRASLANIAITHGLYVAERNHEPLEDIIERMRRDVRCTTAPNAILLSFRYPDPDKAQRVAQDLAIRLITDFDRHVRNHHAMWAQLYRDQIELAATAWAKAAETAQKTPSARTSLDAELAKQAYAGYKQKLDEMELQERLQIRQMGPLLELIDPGARPLRNTSNIGLPLAGLLIGLATAAFARGFR